MPDCQNDISVERAELAAKNTKQFALTWTWGKDQNIGTWFCIREAMEARSVGRSVNYQRAAKYGGKKYLVPLPSAARI